MKQSLNSQPNNTSFFDSLGPRRSFVAGLLVATAVFSILGLGISVAVLAAGGNDAVPSTGRTVSTTPTKETQQLPVQIPAVTDADWVRGDRDAAISIVEFSDTECPFCKRFHPTLQQIVDEYDGTVNWVYRHFPLTSLHSKAPKEAEATECAGELGGNDGFWRYVDELFARTPSNNGLDAAELPEIATAVGLDRTAFELCLASGKYSAKVQAHAQQATAAGAQGTPFSVLVADGRLVPISGALPYEQVKAAVESVRK